MTGVSVGASATYLDDVTLARAAARWGAFFASIDDDECQLLDRFALGDNLKSICFELGLSYDAIRKRLVRRQDALGLPSTATFLHFWMTVRPSPRTVIQKCRKVAVEGKPSASWRRTSRLRIAS